MKNDAGRRTGRRRSLRKVAPKIVHLKPKEAEFAKLISNAWRYIEFATANQFYMMIESAMPGTLMPEPRLAQ